MIACQSALEILMLYAQVCEILNVLCTRTEVHFEHPASQCVADRRGFASKHLTPWLTVVEKHQRFALYHPFAEALSSMLCDLPQSQSTCFLNLLGGLTIPLRQRSSLRSHSTW